MDKVPDEVIRRYCHHFRILSITQSTQWPPRYFDFSVFHCTNLLELDIFLDDGGPVEQEDTDDEEEDTDDDQKIDFGEAGSSSEGGLVTGGAGRGGAESVPSSYAKRLLGSNPQLQCLSWSRPYDYTTALDVEDFVQFTGLQSLRLTLWDCSDGRLGMILKGVAESLKELCVDRVGGIEAGNFSSPLTIPTASQLSHEESRYDVDTVRTDKWTLPRLELLELCARKPNNEYISELIKRCPKLKEVVFCVSYGRWDFNCLAASLGGHCPDIESLLVAPDITRQEAEALIRHCSPSQPQLRKIRMTIDGLNELGLVSAILRHASTLEEVEIYRTQFEKNGHLYIRLLVACTRLKRFKLRSEMRQFDAHILELLRLEAWGCRETLQEMKLDLGFFLGRWTPAERRKEVRLICAVGGWKEVGVKEEKEKEEEKEEEEVGGDDVGHDIEPFDMAKLRQMFELVELLELRQLQTLGLDDLRFQRIRPIF
ncbi:hypothetical protein BGZ97_005814 [Linnemannia gamsii]|uniref:Uncharacterized protein n=1 Tax=Linnemannia gamsii TaxID=64522 RepID=A0A9P6RMU5_9FUNG|nr:hypothetical protein BGZ97_005814 [Linnemannia gamsii]